MSWYRVVAVNEETRPLAGITIEAFDLSARAVVASVVTNRAGEALFTGLTGPQFFRPRNRRTSGTMGDKTFTGRIMIQVVGMDALCYDFIVDSDGGGTDTTLALAVAGAITLAGTSGSATIWMCSSVTEGDIDIGGLGSSAHILITGPDRVAITITATANNNIFSQKSSGGEVAGSLRFHNIGFSIASSFSVLSVETASELDTLEFDRCLFAGGNLLSKTSTNQLGNVVLNVFDCTGTLGEFYDGSTGGGTHSPDSLNAYNNIITLTNWWLGGSPGETRVQGGRYVLGSSSGVTFETGVIRAWFQDLFITFSAANALFTTGSNSNSVDDLIFQNIGIRITNSSGTFGDFGSAASNNNDGLFIKNIYGFGGGTGTFLTVDSDYLNVHVGNLFAKGFSTTYSGPTGVGDDHGLLTGLGDDDHTQYALLAGRSGGQTLIGDTASGGDLILQGTAHATPGDILILSGQGFVVGHTTQIDFGATPEFQVLGTDTSSSSMGFARFENNASGPDVRFLKSRGATIGTNTIVNDGDTLGRFRFQGADGGDFNTTAAEILGRVDGSPSLNDIPGEILFRTRTAAGSLSDKMFLTNAGQVQIIVQGSSAGLLLGGDVQLYRSSANVLTIPDNVVISSSGAALVNLEGTSARLRLKDTDNTDENYELASSGGNFNLSELDDSYVFVATPFRIEAGANSLSLVISAAGQVQLAVTGSTGGILVGADAGFYRSAANVLRMLSGDDLAFDDNDKLVFGTGSDAVIYYDGTNLIIEPDLVGTGEVTIHGEVDIQFVADEDDSHALEIDVTASGFADIKGIDMVYITGALATGEEDEAVFVGLDENAASGGRFSAFEILTTTTGGLNVEGLFSGVGVSPIEQLSGTFANPDSILVNAVDTLSALTNAGSSTSIFVSDNDTVTIGSATKFEEIELIISTGASGAGIAPTFEFSTGVGTWTAFSPSDGTNGMRNTGEIAWEDSDIPTWVVGLASEYLIRITRTRNSLTTTPVADFLQIADATEYRWDNLGNLHINNLIAELRTYSTLMAVPEIGFGAQTVATLSGNELTDITRGLATQGDGRDTPDSSFGLWEATTNLIPNGGLESNTTGWANHGGAAAIARDTSFFKFGTASLKVTTGTGTFNGVNSPVATVAAETQITVSFWIYRTEAAVPMALLVRDESGGFIETSGAIPLIANRWQRFEFTTTTNVGDTGAIARITKNNDATDITFYIDGLQIEIQPIATPYVETDGGTASRSDARVRLPIDLDESVGWIAIRLRAGWTSTGDPSSNPVVWQWRDDDSNMFELRYDTANNQWDFERINGGSAGEVSIADAYSSGDYITLVAAWTATTLMLSLDGEDFVSANDTNIPTLSATTIDVGSHVGSSEYFDSDIVWVVGGKGTLTDLDADGFDANANRPLRRVDLPTVSIPTLGWDANSGALLPDILLQEPDTLYMNYTTGRLELPTVGSSAGLLIGSDVQLYRSSANILRTPDSMVIDGTLEVGTVQTYAASNVNTDRTYDADATSTDELADVLGTLIADLRAIGLIN